MLTVIKRNGDRVLYDEEAIHKVVSFACKGLQGVSVSDVVLHAGIQAYDGITTAEIQDLLIKSAADKISEETPNYQYVAANLNLFKIRKQAYGCWAVPSLYDHIKHMVDEGWYDAELLKKYSKDELDKLNSVIEHDYDLKFSYVATKQFEGKYLIKNRVTGRVMESPQMALMCISLSIFQDYIKNKSSRLSTVEEFYHHLAEQDISLPTPIMAGARTPLRQFSSCVLIECEDSLDSITATGTAIMQYVSRMAGIGLNVGRIRAKGTPVRNGAVYHTGITPFLKFFQAAVQSCSAGGVRSGAATVYYPLWHLEVEDMLVLKNNRGVEENRARHMDYGVQINGYLYRRLQKNELITLFSPNDVRDLYDAFFADQDAFASLYEKYEKDDRIKKKQVPAIDLFSLLMRERASTGRIYIMNVDHCNTHSSFDEKVAPVKQSNLCAEVTLPTVALSNKDHNQGEIALCVLGAVNVGKVGLDRDKMKICTRLLVYALDAIIEHQSYPLIEAEKNAKGYRSLGIGIINYAYFLAKNGVKYSDDKAIKLTHELIEMFQYYCIEASAELAKVNGPCKNFNRSKYGQGILPIDTYYKKNIDKLIDSGMLKMDWEVLRKKMKANGMRNCALTALMPSETSSQISNSTNGIEPPRALISVKQSKNGILKQVVPDIEKLSNQYELLWEMKDNKHYLNIVGIMQKFIDQSISANTNYDPEKFPEGKVPMQLLLKDLLYAYALGIKTLYYHNTRDNASEEQVNACMSGACKI